MPKVPGLSQRREESGGGDIVSGSDTSSLSRLPSRARFYAASRRIVWRL